MRFRTRDFPVPAHPDINKIYYTSTFMGLVDFGMAVAKWEWGGISGCSGWDKIQVVIYSLTNVYIEGGEYRGGTKAETKRTRTGGGWSRVTKPTRRC